MHSDRKIFTLVFGLLWLVVVMGWLVNSEREIDRLNERIAQLESERVGDR